MTNNNYENMDALVNAVSKKLGISPEQLQSELKAGKFDSALKNMKPAEEAKFKQILSNPHLLDKFMSTPQAQSLYNKLTGGK